MFHLCFAGSNLAAFFFFFNCLPAGTIWVLAGPV